jgi:hypothetical protein
MMDPYTQFDLANKLDRYAILANLPVGAAVRVSHGDGIRVNITGKATFSVGSIGQEGVKVGDKPSGSYMKVKFSKTIKVLDRRQLAFEGEVEIEHEMEIHYSDLTCDAIQVALSL